MILTPLEPEDLELLYTIENDPTLWNVSNNNVPYSRYALKNYIASQNYDIYADKQVRLAARVTSDSMQASQTKPIALVDLFNFSPEHMRAEVGIAVLKSEQGKGYGRQAIRLITEYARNTLHLHCIYAIIPETNTASLKMLRAEGFGNELRLKDWILSTDGWHDAIHMQLLI